MDHKQLNELVRLGGEVVEIRLNNGRRAIGYLETADTDRIALRAINLKGKAIPISYRSTQSSGFTRLDQAESISIEHNPPKPGTRIMIRLKSNVRICGYTITATGDQVTLAREIFGNGRNKRSHRHFSANIESTYVLKPIEN